MNRLILHVPLLEVVPGGADALPAPLRQTLARARRTQQAPAKALAGLLGTPPLPAPAVLSALALPGHAAEVGHHHWLRFDPVRLVPDLTAVWVDRPLPLDFGAQALRPVVDELQSMFEHEGLAWVRQGGSFGLLRLDSLPDCVFPPPDTAYGKRLDEVLPSGPDASRWRRLINESQMVFHQFRTPDRADQQGVGLWFWGVGGPPEPPDGAIRASVVDPAGSAEVRGLAEWLGADLYDAAARFDALDSPCRYVNWPLQSTDPVAALERLSQLWVAPALHALRRNRLAEIDIVGSSGFWRLGRLDSLAVWRRSIAGLEPDGDPH